MEPIVWLVVIVIAIGAIVAGAVGIAALFVGWWFLIPIISACLGGVFGFLFGLGLVVIIGIIILACRKSQWVNMGIRKW